MERNEEKLPAHRLRAARREDPGQVTWGLRPGMRQHERDGGAAQGHPKERGGVLETEGPGGRGYGLRAREGSGGRAQNTGIGGQRMLGRVSLICLMLPEDRPSSPYDPRSERGRVMMRQHRLRNISLKPGGRPTR